MFEQAPQQKTAAARQISSILGGKPISVAINPQNGVSYTLQDLSKIKSTDPKESGARFALTVATLPNPMRDQAAGKERTELPPSARYLFDAEGKLIGKSSAAAPGVILPGTKAAPRSSAEYLTEEKLTSTIRKAAEDGLKAFQELQAKQKR